MADYITLLGSEQVASAANQMRQAASDMQRAADSISNSLEMNQRRMDERLQRFGRHK